MEDQLNAMIENALATRKEIFSPQSPSKIKRKRVLPSAEIEPNLKNLMVVTPVFNRPSTSFHKPCTSEKSEILYDSDGIDTAALMVELSEFMTVHGVSQSHIARKLNIQQIWISRMMAEPREWEKLQDSGRDHCRVLRNWLNEPLKERLATILEEIRFTEQELNNCEIDTREMVLQIDKEMEQHKLPLTDYSRGSGIKYTWLYNFIKSPNIYDGFNMVGKHQARQLHEYLKIPFDERMKQLRVSKGVINASLDTVDIAVRVNEVLKREVLSLRGVCKQLSIDNSRASVLLRQPIPWEKLNVPGKKMFQILKDWLQNFNHLFPPLIEKELNERKMELVESMTTPQPKKRAKLTGAFPELNSHVLAKQVKNNLKNFKISTEKLGDHLGIPHLHHLLMKPGRWERLDDDVQEDFRALKRWLDSPNQVKMLLSEMPRLIKEEGVDESYELSLTDMLKEIKDEPDYDEPYERPRAFQQESNVIDLNEASGLENDPGDHEVEERHRKHEGIQSSQHQEQNKISPLIAVQRGTTRSVSAQFQVANKSKLPSRRGSQNGIPSDVSMIRFTVKTPMEQLTIKLCIFLIEKRIEYEYKLDNVQFTVPSTIHEDFGKLFNEMGFNFETYKVQS